MIFKNEKLRRKIALYTTFSILLFISFPIFTFFHCSSLQLNNRSIINLPSTSDTLSLDWHNTWGTSDDDSSESGYGIAIDGSGNIFITGTTTCLGAGGQDVLLLKYDSFGNLLWEKTWGGTNYDYGKAIAIDGSGNVYLTGTTDSYGGIFVLKYNSFGNLLWERTWGGWGSEFGSGIALDNMGNIFITGITTSYGVGDRDILVLKYNSDGNLLWNTTYGGFNEEWGIGIAVDISGNMFITGLTESYGAGEWDMLLLKYDSSGTLLWNTTWGGSKSDHGSGIALDALGNVFITGSTKSYGAGNGDALVLKYDSFGTLLWSKTWGSSDNDFGCGIAVDSSGNMFITGSTYSIEGGGHDALLFKYDPSGNLLLNKTWGGSGYDSGEVGYGIALDDSGNVFITGENYYYGTFDVFLLKYGIDTDSDGLSDSWEVKYGLNATWSGDASLDGDNDGLTNLEEYKIKLDPTDSDTDDDGLSDGDELNIYKTDPNDSDSDSDGFSDGEEIQLSTDPLSALSNLFTTLIIIIVIVISVGAVSSVVIMNYRKRKKNKIER